MNLDVNPFTIWWTEGARRNERAIQFLTIDAVLEERHMATSTISKYPVQRGFEVSDHAIRHNQMLKVTGILVNTEIGGVDVDGTLAGGVVGSLLGQGALGTAVGGLATDPAGAAANYIDGAISAAGTVLNPTLDVYNGLAERFDFLEPTEDGTVEEILGGQAPASRIQQAFKILDNLVQEGTICQVSTMLKVYDPVVLVSCTVPQTLDYSTTMMVELMFEQVKILDRDGNVAQNVALGDVNEEDRRDAREKATQTLGGQLAGDATDYINGVVDNVSAFTEGLTEGFTEANGAPVP